MLKVSLFLIIAIILFYVVRIIRRVRKHAKKRRQAIELLDKLKSDWIRSSTYWRSRSISTYREKGILIYKYITLTGEEIYMLHNHIITKNFRDGNHHFILDDDIKEMYKIFANDTIKYVNYASQQSQGTQGSQGSQKQQNSSKKKATGSQGAKEGKSSKSKNAHVNHPKWDVYQVLLRTAKSRKEQLLKLPKNDSSRSNLENELVATESRIKTFKEKYKF